jgi:restriction system protein
MKKNDIGNHQIKKYSDNDLEEKIENLKTIVKSLIDKHDLWHKDNCGFKSYAEYYDDEPTENPCVLVLWFDGDVLDAINGWSCIDLGEEISQALEHTEFLFEPDDHRVGGFYVEDYESELAEAFRDYFEWFWICDLIKPDYSALYEEIFDRFHKKPDDMYKLSPRKYEEFLEIVFLNNGYRTVLGKGSNDGGVDLRLYSHDLVNESITLVQAKRYKNPIELQAVQALTAVVDDQKANRGLFITTSRYLPCAEKFAARQNSRIQLASSKEVAEWCHSASCRIIRDKSTLVEFEQIKNLLKSSSGKGLEGKIFHANSGYTNIDNSYAMVIKETKGVSLLVQLPKKIHTHDGYGQRGTHLPDTSFESLSKLGKLYTFRAKKYFNKDNKFEYLRGKKLLFSYDENNQLESFFGSSLLFSLWNKKPNDFDSD